MEVEEFLKEAAVMKEVKHPNLVQLLGQYLFNTHDCILLINLSIYFMYENNNNFNTVRP